MASLWLADYTWPDVEKLLEQGFDSLLLMLGATEQHGPHLPLSTDTILAEALALDIAARLGQTLVAPIIPIGTSDEHKEFCGTLSLSKATLAGLIYDLGFSASRHGFKRLLVLSSHGGNYEAIRQGVTQLRQNVADLEVIAFTDLIKAMQTVTNKESADLPEAVMGWHAGERETSQMLHLRPDLVQMERAAAGYIGDMQTLMPRLKQAGLRPVTANGVLGDPTLATAARGKIYLEQVALALVAAINTYGASNSGN